MLLSMIAKRYRPGQALVETALTLGILIFLIIHTFPIIQLLAVRYGLVSISHLVAARIGEVGIDLPTRPPTRSETWKDITLRWEMVDSQIIGLASNPFIDDDRITVRAWCTPRLVSNRCNRFDTITVELSYRDEPWVRTALIPEIAIDVRATASYQHVPIGGSR